MLVAGVSGHPGKFGFVTLHNLLAAGYKGNVFGTNLNAEEVLGIRTVASVDELPDGVIDLVFVCTPASTVPDVLRACAAKGIRAAFLTSAGFAEAGDEGIAAQAELVALSGELGMLLVGPNGQGVVSTPGRPVRPDRRPVPATGSDRRRQPERQLRVELHEHGGAARASASPARCRPATPRRSGWRTSSSTTAPIPRRPSRSATSRASRTAPS
ncbi:MAG: CoA-binding protein [Ilumatobacteraceae bacterium]